MNDYTYTCTHLFNSEVEPGGWSNGGVSIDSVENTTITCTSTHLTNFAALVGVSGATQVYHHSTCTFKYDYNSACTGYV